MAGRTFGERAADRMKAALSTWRAIGLIVLGLVVWIMTGGFGKDPFPFILLNLCLSCLAALQCFILLIAQKRADEIAAELAQHDHEIGLKDFSTDQENNRLLLLLVEHLGLHVGEDDGEH